MSDNASRVAVVSGGSRGIGRAIVLRLAEDGFDVSFCYRSNVEAAEELVAMAGKFGTRVTMTQADVADPVAVRAWITEAEAELGPVEVAVTSAGITRDGPLVTMTDETWLSVVDTNLNGASHVCRAASFGMMKRRKGCLINLTSVSGVYGNARQTNYSASKAGIIGLSKALAKEVGKYGIRVNAVAPGFIDTDMTAAMPASATAKISERIALGRMGTAEEVADLVGFLASDRAAYITGAVLEIHGGISL
jgi:3-oxoacyl-[acyl-carrier protein] reductase